MAEHIPVDTAADDSNRTCSTPGLIACANRRSSL